MSATSVLLLTAAVCPRSDGSRRSLVQSHQAATKCVVIATTTRGTVCAADIKFSTVPRRHAGRLSRIRHKVLPVLWLESGAPTVVRGRVVVFRCTTVASEAVAEDSLSADRDVVATEECAERQKRKTT